jgi:CheY-like chemotaxis protein
MNRTIPQFPPKHDKKGLRILCADDSKQIRDLMHLLLTQDGHEVTTAPDGLCAHQLIQSDPTRYDILITDHNMPGKTGLELVMALRESIFRGPILVLCSPLPASVADDYRRQGATVILDKPVGFSALRQTVLLLEHFVPKHSQSSVQPAGPKESAGLHSERPDSQR